MANSLSSDKLLMLSTSLVRELRDDFSHPIGFLQFGAIGVTYIFAWLSAREIKKYLEKISQKDKAHMRFVLSSLHFAILLKYLIWMLLLWFCRVFFQAFSISADFLPTAFNLAVVLMIFRLASAYIKSTFWSRFVYVGCTIYVILRTLKLWGPTQQLLDSMKIELGEISISVWGLAEAIIVFIVLWAAAGAANRFIAHWLTASTRLTYSDRTLLQRVIRAATIALVILVSMKAAGIHMTAVVVTGGAIGFAIGIGLQKIGSNLVSGMMLLISKPLRLGDVITFEKGFAGASWGWITQMDLMYVHVATRNGSLLLVPNEVFLTQKIENLSYDNNRVRLIIPFAIAYDSDLVKAKTLAASAAGSVARILKIPEPKCYVREYEDSTVNLELRVWIDDPKNGMGNVRDAVRMAVWDSYRANGVEFAFPQRDLHIKNAVPLEIIRKSAPPVEMNSGDPDGN